MAGAAAKALEDAGVAVFRTPSPAAIGRDIRSAHALIIADPLTDPASAIAGLRTLCRRFRARRPPLRTILVDEEDGVLPSLDMSDDSLLLLEIFNLRRQAARALLANRPLHEGMDPPFGQSVHLLLAGNAPPAHALMLQALRLAHYGNVPVLTFACTDPVAEREAWLAAYPQAERFCRLDFTELHAPNLPKDPPVTSVFVCVERPEHGLELAQQLAKQVADAQQSSPVIHLEVGDTRPQGDIGEWDGQVLPFSWLREACRPEVLLEARGDELARVIHEHYRDSIAAQGRDPAGEPGGRPWERLATSYREASRQQADHLWAKLAAVDCRAVSEELVESFAFAPLEVERLARIEHSRWAADRYLDGWTYGPVRDNIQKHHPQLIPYAELSRPMKDLDRFAVRLVPTLLARSSRSLVRMLLVGVPEVRREPAADGFLRRLADAALARLAERYPDRSLVVSSTLADPHSRLVVRRALDAFGASLFVLCAQPVAETLSAQRDDGARRDLLELLARVERRIPLAGADGLAAWFARRAEILLIVGTEAQEVEKRKRVTLDPVNRRLEWTFEY
ncbi:MAG: RyR domain-containing protein [Chromatiaceae bacterium]